MAPKYKLDHISLLVKDLDQAIADWQAILEVLDPDQAGQLVRDRGTENGEDMEWVTWVNPDPDGCSIQLFTSHTPGGFLRKRLEKRGEGVHHVAFTTTDLDATVKDLKEKGVPLLCEPVGPENNPWLRWTFVPQDKAHGVLVEVATRYKVENGRWVPDFEVKP